MDRQTRTGDTVLVKSREVTGRSQILPWWLGGEGVKTTEIKIQYIGPVGIYHKNYITRGKVVFRSKIQYF